MMDVTWTLNWLCNTINNPLYWLLEKMFTTSAVNSLRGIMPFKQPHINTGLEGIQSNSICHVGI